MGKIATSMYLNNLTGHTHPVDLSYCPTFEEIEAFWRSYNPSLSITGSYADDQCVQESDLDCNSVKLTTTNYLYFSIDNSDNSPFNEVSFHVGNSAGADYIVFRSLNFNSPTRLIWGSLGTSKYPVGILSTINRIKFYVKPRSTNVSYIHFTSNRTININGVSNTIPTQVHGGDNWVSLSNPVTLSISGDNELKFNEINASIY